MARREMMGTRDFVQRYEDRALRKIAIKMNKEIWTFVGKKSFQRKLKNLPALYIHDYVKLKTRLSRKRPS